MNKLSLLLLLALPLLSACTQAPAINLLGAYFPDWLFCILGGVLITLLVRGLLGSGRGAKWLAPELLIYPLLTALFSLALWLIFFNLYL
jgi:hypothetical protein